MTIDQSLTHLGCGIYQFSGADPASIPALRGLFKFMNVLWLPAKLPDLSPEQIVIVNRFREANIADDQQFRSANFSRSAIVSVLKKTFSGALLEIGCGKFPISRDIQVNMYRGIDIDQEAIDWCREQGLNVGLLTDFSDDRRSVFNMMISLYVFHFDISADLIEYLNVCMHGQAYLVFNLIMESEEAVRSKIAPLAAHFPCVHVIKTAKLSTKEYFVVMGRAVAQAAISDFARELDGVLGS